MKTVPSSNIEPTSEPTVVPVRRSLISSRSRLAWIGFLFTVPALVYFVWWVFIPMIYGLWVSLTNDTLLAPPNFVGLSNYAAVLTDSQFWHSAGRTALYVVEVVIPSLVIAFMAAWLISKSKRGQSFYLSSFFLPFVVPSVASAVVFELLLQPSGLLNQALHIHVAWLSNPKVALIGLSIVTVWNLVGYYVVIFLAGLQQVPSELLEAGQIDGVTSIQSLWYIILPLIRPTILFSSVSCIATVLTNFATPYVMTQGGPGNSTLVMPLLIYKTAFEYSNAGGAAAMAAILLIVSLFLTWAQFRWLGEKGD